MDIKVNLLLELPVAEHADRRRFYQVVWPHRATVLRTARFLCRDADEAEDLVQEVFIKAYRSLAQLEGERGAVAWLMTILRHSHIDRLRARKGHPTLSLESSEIDPVDTRDSIELGVDYSPAALLETLSDQTVIDALHELPEDIRWTLLLVDVQGMDLESAARIEGVPVGTIKSRAHRGREMLRKLLVPRPVLRLAI